jgi:hypothetical protein
LDEGVLLHANFRAGPECGCFQFAGLDTLVEALLVRVDNIVDFFGDILLSIVLLRYDFL